jgi:hypothetical protein
MYLLPCLCVLHSNVQCGDSKFQAWRQFNMCQYVHELALDHAIAEAVCCQLPTRVAQVQSQVRSCDICGGQSGRFPLSIFIPQTAPHSSLTPPLETHPHKNIYFIMYCKWFLSFFIPLSCCKINFNNTIWYVQSQVTLAFLSNLSFARTCHLCRNGPFLEHPKERKPLLLLSYSYAKMKQD